VIGKVGLGVGVLVGEGVGVLVTVGVAILVGVGVAILVGVGVLDGVGVGKRVGVEVAILVGVGVFVGKGCKITVTLSEPDPPGPVQFKVNILVTNKSPTNSVPLVDLEPDQPFEALQLVAFDEVHDKVTLTPGRTVRESLLFALMFTEGAGGVVG
jgi:hypothetical protein